MGRMILERGVADFFKIVGGPGVLTRRESLVAAYHKIHCLALSQQQLIIRFIALP